mmetsp:Transcript_24222/g.42867  ORF Transcript_24222/g.42867 Transcript_24222/m.42867 type:complete len:166 (+) Transcript_24222:316-813(+)
MVLEHLQIFHDSTRTNFEVSVEDLDDAPTPTKPTAAAADETKCHDDADYTTDTDSDSDDEQAHFDDLGSADSKSDFKHIDDVLESIDPRGQLWWDLKEGEAPIMADEDFFEMKEGAKDLPDFDDARYLDDCEDFEEHYSEEEGEYDDCEDHVVDVVQENNLLVNL